MSSFKEKERARRESFEQIWKTRSTLYSPILKVCLKMVSFAIRSGPEARACRDYFVDAIRLFYSTEELSRLLSELGFSDVIGRSLLGGTVAMHKACKA